MSVKRVRKIVKKNMKSYPRRKLSGAGYKGHRPGTAKEAIHRLYDKFGPGKSQTNGIEAGRTDNGEYFMESVQKPC